MRYYLLTALLLCNVSAQAESVYKFDADVIDSSIKCELATVAKRLSSARLPASRLLALVEIKGTETTNTAAGASFSIPIISDLLSPKGSGAISHETTQLRGAKGIRNIDSKNIVNCKKSFVVDVGIADCFREQRTLFVDGNTISCSTKKTATAKADLSGKFTIWAIDIGPSGSLSKTRVWEVSISAPPDKK